ncbi:MAG TPA: DcaP family trimeric outer membrane transporter [Verrucomicrobiae bacterium]|jgi:hypothetical protein
MNSRTRGPIVPALFSMLGRSVLPVVLLAAGGAIQAQDDPRVKELEALRATVGQLENSLREVRGKLADMERRYGAGSTTNAAVASMAPTFTETNATAGSNYMVIAGQKIELPNASIKPAQGRSPIPNNDTFNDSQQAAPRPDNKPIDPELAGFLPIPGTKSMIRFGGSARLDGIYDFADNGNPNQFLPSTIPASGQAGEDGNNRATVHAKGTRISFEVRRPADEDKTLRIFNENDFFSDSSSSDMEFRVRHFYGQARNLLVGQTYSAFMDIDAWADVLNYIGPGAIINRRQPQIRYSPPVYDGVGKMHLLFSVEQPESELSTSATGLPAGAKTFTPLPDGVAGWRWEGDVGHVQLTGLFREIGYEADHARDDTAFGWGANASGAFNLSPADKIFLQVAYGEGMARYINDLNSANLDAAPDNSGNLQALPVFATTVGYTHQWSKEFRSTACYGYIEVDQSSSLGAFAMEKTHYASANLVWHPTKDFRMGLEYLYGRKDTRSGAEGEGHRLNFVFRYDLIR